MLTGGGSLAAIIISAKPAVRVGAYLNVPTWHEGRGHAWEQLLFRYNNRCRVGAWRMSDVILARYSGLPQEIPVAERSASSGRRTATAC